MSPAEMDCARLVCRQTETPMSMTAQAGRFIDVSMSEPGSATTSRVKVCGTRVDCEPALREQMVPAAPTI
jgi:hypothetical protein